MALSGWIHKLVNVVALLGLLLSPVQSLAVGAGLAPARGGQPAAAPPALAAEPAMPEYTGLFRTTVMVRGPADWARLEGLGVVVLEPGGEGKREKGNGMVQLRAKIG